VQPLPLLLQIWHTPESFDRLSSPVMAEAGLVGWLKEEPANQ